MKTLPWNVFCDQQPGVFFVHPENPNEGLCRKGSTIRGSLNEPVDFFYSCLIAQSINGGPLEIDLTETRYALFDNANIVVYEYNDITLILQRLFRP